MRLIDANALISDLEHDVERDMAVLDTLTLGRASREIIQFDKDWKQNTIDLLMRAPTIEPEPKRGKWLLHTDERFDIDYYKCSECGYEPYRKMDISNFCPNCGADMGGERNEIHN